MKDVNYYMGLKYHTEVKKIPDDEGGGFCATIPELGEFAFLGDGETEEEALKNLEENKKSLFEDYLEKGISIPEPIDTSYNIFVAWDSIHEVVIGAFSSEEKAIQCIDEYCKFRKLPDNDRYEIEFEKFELDKYDFKNQFPHVKTIASLK